MQDMIVVVLEMTFEGDTLKREKGKEGEWEKKEMMTPNKWSCAIKEMLITEEQQGKAMQLPLH